VAVSHYLREGELRSTILGEIHGAAFRQVHEQVCAGLGRRERLAGVSAQKYQQQRPRSCFGTIYLHVMCIIENAGEAAWPWGQICN
jgi:hypothetical protein